MSLIRGIIRRGERDRLKYQRLCMCASILTLRELSVTPNISSDDRNKLFSSVITDWIECRNGNQKRNLSRANRKSHAGDRFWNCRISFWCVSAEKMKDYILQAIKVGYRHFDTASLYESEQPLGEAISEALQLGLIKSRDELFVTSKLWCSDAHHDRVLPALRKSLENLKLEYLDLYLIHWPVSFRPDVCGMDIKKEDIVPFDFRGIWEAMEECQKLGLAKSIGVSNFSCKKLEIELANAKIPPAVNQVEMSPHWQQKKLREYCAKKGIHITAYSPLGAQGTFWGTNRVMNCENLKEIAHKTGKSLPQVCLRWAYEQGVSVLVKSFKEERMRENIEIFDWQLSSEDLEKITQTPQKKGFPAIEFTSDDGPYKSLDELWDGEI